MFFALHYKEIAISLPLFFSRRWSDGTSATKSDFCLQAFFNKIEILKHFEVYLWNLWYVITQKLPFFCTAYDWESPPTMWVPHSKLVQNWELVCPTLILDGRDPAKNGEWVWREFEYIAQKIVWSWDTAKGKRGPGSMIFLWHADISRFWLWTERWSLLRSCPSFLFQLLTWPSS